VLDNFWDEFYDYDYLDEIDPEDKVTVYHRKGKDWYISYSMEEKEFEILYFDDWSEEFKEEWFSYAVYQEDDGIFDKIEGYLKSLKRDIEIKSYIYNELRQARHYDEWSYNDDIFNLKIIEKEYDIWDFAGILCDYIDYKSSEDVKGMVANAYNRFLASKIQDGKLFGKYKHLQQIKELAEADGKELVYSRIGDFTEDMTYAIKYKDEEYHFSLEELFNSAPKEFYKHISRSLTKRLYERYENSILLQKAKYVFVGLDDSYNAGNCKAGTSAWTSKHGIDTKKIGAIRGDEILRLDFSSFTKRAVLQAIKRVEGK